MRVLQKIIPIAILAVPLMGVASSSYPGHPGITGSASSSDSDSVSIGTVIDEVIWVVGDEAILKSDVEVMRMQAAMEGVKWGSRLYDPGADRRPETVQAPGHHRQY